MLCNTCYITVISLTAWVLSKTKLQIWDGKFKATKRALFVQWFVPFLLFGPLPLISSGKYYYGNELGTETNNGTIEGINGTVALCIMDQKPIYFSYLAIIVMSFLVMQIFCTITDTIIFVALIKRRKAAKTNSAKQKFHVEAKLTIISLISFLCLDRFLQFVRLLRISSWTCRLSVRLHLCAGRSLSSVQSIFTLGFFQWNSRLFQTRILCFVLWPVNTIHGGGGQPQPKYANSWNPLGSNSGSFLAHSGVIFGNY